MYSAKYELEGDLPISSIYNKTNILEKEDKPNLLLNAELGFRYKIYKSIYFHHAVSATKYFINNNYGFLMLTSGISLGI